MYKDIELSQLDELLQQSATACMQYRNMPLSARAQLMKTIAAELEACGDALIKLAMDETHLPEARLRNERQRTIYQLHSYADACLRGEWMEIRIDTALPDKMPPRPDIRKMMQALGPVAVFGASNFPFAYSTAGGDTACALAAGCSVVVKAHPAHAGTSQMVADAVMRAVQKCKMPAGVFTHIHGAHPSIGEALVNHPLIKAVGFTGSFAGGQQLFLWGSQRNEPIPVFAEMGSVNPVFLLPQKLSASAGELAHSMAASITMGVGQFCTNPGIMVGIQSEALSQFTDALRNNIETGSDAPMLHKGIASSYATHSATALAQQTVTIVATQNNRSESYDSNLSAHAIIATTTAENFIQNPLLRQEVFGPFSLLVQCRDMAQMIEVAEVMDGQLTATVMATVDEAAANKHLLELLQQKCGRFILNGVPTGVEVCLSMQHGGPYPATTDSRFTSVGADGIKRFARPIAFQNWPDELLPDALKRANPLQLWRTINDVPGLH